MPCPCSTRCSAAAVAALKPLASDALAIRRSVRCRSPESIASMRSRSLPGKSPRMGLSPHARGFLASAGSRQAGFPDGSPAPANTRGAACSPSCRHGCGSPRRTRAGRPAGVHPRHDGAREVAVWSRSRRYPPCPPCAQPIRRRRTWLGGSGSMSSRSSANMSRIVLPDR